MEALATLSLVCNVFQVISFTGEVFRLVRSLQNDGSPDPGLASSTKHLSQMVSTLTNNLHEFNAFQSPDKTPSQQQEAEERLKALTMMLLQDTEKLKTILKKLASTTSQGKPNAPSKKIGNIISKRLSNVFSEGKTFSVLLKYKLRYESEITSLEMSIDRVQTTLNTEFLLRLCDSRVAEKARSEKAFADLDQNLQKFIRLWSEGCRDMSMLITTEAENTRMNFKAEASMLRNQIDTIAQASDAHADARHHATRNHVTSELLKSKKQEDRAELTARILSTLRFPLMNARENNIKLVSEDTTRWIFDQKSLDSKAVGANFQFSQWLEAEDHVFWISGKPGSGKSSLMKFLVLDARTKDHLSKWRPDVTICRYFFIETGADLLQREFRGCLRALLYQILESKPHILDPLLQENSELARKRSEHDWSVDDLRKTFLTALRLANSPICIFLDGLDEIAVRSDDRRSIIELVKDLSDLDDVKICVSSRPENIFIAGLGSYPVLRTQDMNESAIALYIQKHLTQYQPSSPTGLIKYERLSRILVEKASGVFLWVYLAIRSIINGIENGDTWHILFQRVEGLEPNLHAVFEQMLKRQNADAPFYRKDTAILLWHSLYAATMPIGIPNSLLAHILATHEELRCDLLRSVADEQRSTAEKRVFDEYRKWLFARSAGLLEINEYPYGPSRELADSLLVHYIVRPIHRSVQEFLLATTEGHDILLFNHTSSEERLLRITGAMKDICYYLAGNRSLFEDCAELLYHLVRAGYLTPQEETEELLDFRSRLQSRAPEEFPDSFFIKEAARRHNAGFLCKVPGTLDKLSPEDKSLILSQACQFKITIGVEFTDLITLNNREAERKTLEDDSDERMAKRLSDIISLLLSHSANLNERLTPHDLNFLTISRTPFHDFLVAAIDSVASQMWRGTIYYPISARCFPDFTKFEIDWNLPFYFCPLLYGIGRQHRIFRFEYLRPYNTFPEGWDCIFQTSSKWLYGFLARINPSITREQREIDFTNELASADFSVRCVAVRRRGAGKGYCFQRPDPNKSKEKQLFESITRKGFLGWLYDMPEKYKGIRGSLPQYVEMLSEYEDVTG
ncbi:hypothetical protein F5B22DRAFT_515889 [Xylaria bambusicola]|uniref:uncharacterized protein n=1 Tax=Xylaria bambusicola TaxID=326684 RepID=UPI002008C251|nr:uncharacterized protein F5B22DRAFT_515889 [Xylaria bambusicola]KAI0505627.1 hypothetical protein F5B22DRAFT_515889 [Xylaria bambusicola]